MKRTLELYREAYRQHGRSPASLLIPKGRQALRFSSLTRSMAGAGFSVLDFGCGFGDLKTYLDARFRDVRYSGVDVMPEFIEECRKTYGAQAGFRHITSHTDVRDEYDYVVISGVFNTLFHEARQAHSREVRAILRHLFSRTRRLLAFDFMTDQADYQLPGAYHENPADIYAFVRQELSPRLLLDQSYMPYEFSVAVYRDAQIRRPDNVYAGSADAGG
jgi:cyclopropane fatty-acyl-phospholipid synthase-like methyltransferase